LVIRIGNGGKGLVLAVRLDGGGRFFHHRHRLVRGALVGSEDGQGQQAQTNDNSTQKSFHRVSPFVSYVPAKIASHKSFTFAACTATRAGSMRDCSWPCRRSWCCHLRISR